MTTFKKSLLIFKLVLLTGFLASCGENKDTPKSDSKGVAASDVKETPKSESKVVMASDVTDKTSLKAFVDQAKEHLDKNYDQAIKDFSGLEKWKKDSIYLYIISGEGLSVFHPTLQGQNIMGLTDPNGVKITEELLKAGKAGGGFVEYKWDNPAVENDNGNSDKVGYVVPFTKDNKFHILGSGIYLEYTGAETTKESTEKTTETKTN